MSMRSNPAENPPEKPDTKPVDLAHQTEPPEKRHPESRR